MTDAYSTTRRKAGRPSLYGDKYPEHHLHPRVGEFEVRETQDKGMALHALERFHATELMARFDGHTTSTVTQHSLQLREGEHIIDLDFIGMLAHSCQPNVKLDMQKRTMTAVREIFPGDVLSMDYAATEAELFNCFPCSCGAPSCRGYITGYRQVPHVEAARAAAKASGAIADALLAAPAEKPVIETVAEHAARVVAEEGQVEYRQMERYGIRYYGQHLMLTGLSCNEHLLDIGFMQRFLSALADEIGMVRFGDAHVHRFGGGIEVGLSGFQLIETSQVSFHSNDGARDIYLDVFSCRAYDERKVEAFVQAWLEPSSLETILAWRR